MSRNPLELVYFGLFDDCNVRCNMCDCWRLPRTTRDFDHFAGVLDRLLELAPRSIRITGGEPLLLRRVTDLIRRGAAHGSRMSVITNGRLLAGRATALVEAGCEEVVLSLDGPPEIHDRIRDFDGLFDRAMAGIRALAVSGLDYGVNTVVQRLNARALPALADRLLAERHPPRWWHILPLHGFEDLAASTDEDMARLTEDLISLRSRLSDSGIELVTALDMAAEQEAAHCSVPSFTCYVRADTGAVFGCNMLAYSERPIGNLISERPRDVWLGSTANRLRMLCAAGTNADCGRCDPASRTMNHVLRRLGKRVIAPATPHSPSGA